MIRKRQTFWVLTACAAFLLPATAQGNSITNGGFEAGTTGWTGPISSVGQFEVVSPLSIAGPAQWDPVEGDAFGLLQASAGAGAVSASVQVEAQAGDILSFQWFWATPYVGGFDRVRAVLSQNGTQLTGLDVLSGDYDFGQAEILTTDWTPHSYEFPFSGTFDLVFEVSSLGETPPVPTSLGIDAVQILPPAAPIPEPLSLLGVSLAVLAGGAYARRRRCC
jgi:hypothetical protein